MRDLTRNEVYEIASEVCEEMMTKFLQNLVKLIPDAEETLEDIEENHYRAYKRVTEGSSRQQERRGVAPLTIPKEEEEVIEEEDEIAALAHPKEDKLQESFLNDDFISSLPTECDGMPGAEQGIGIDPAIAAMGN